MSQLFYLLLKNLVQRFFHLPFVDLATTLLVNLVILPDQKTLKLLVIVEFVLNHVAVVALVDVVFVLRYESVKEDFVVKGVHCSLLFPLLHAEKICENAFFDGTVYEHAHFILRKRSILRRTKNKEGQFSKN